MAITGSLPELLLPAGGFDSGLAAIEGGADALYLGFADFSARKQARNFDRLEYRRLYRLARDKGIKLYAALNTVILQDELQSAAGLLAFLGRVPPDAVIVQDWGLARIIKDRHPAIAIHASTQAAVQGASAARIARELGASRIVLPRETSLEEMKRLSREVPGIECETFVHGALCYSFSGLCLASGLVLGRSGNRGDCAQLCRSYYRVEGCPGKKTENGGLTGREGYWFSCRDLDLSDRLEELAAAGISSLKVEGRMKSPEYCYAVASLYRGSLDRLIGKGPDDAELRARREAARIAFARSPTEGRIRKRGGASLIDSAYPGHRGVPVGRIISNDRGKLILLLEGKLGLRDGLLGFDRGESSRPLRFSALELRDAATGREILRAKAGSRVGLVAQAEGRPCEGLRPGDALYLVSARDLDRKVPSPEEYEPAKEELPLMLFFSSSGLRADLALPGFGRLREASATVMETASIDEDDPLPVELAKSAGGLKKALTIFGESGEADFRLLPDIEASSRVELPPGADGSPRSCAPADLFVPPSILKREKNRVYARAAELIAEAERDYAAESWTKAKNVLLAPEDHSFSFERPPRAALVFKREELPSGMPFATPRDLAESADMPSWGGRSWLPLAPLVGDRESYSRLVEERVTAALSDGRQIVIGLGALHHLSLARELKGIFSESGRSLAFFLDFNLYIASDIAFATFSELLPEIEFAYRYLEAEGKASFDSIRGPLVPCGPGFEPPLFQSLGCLLKHHIAGGACPSGCGKLWSTVFSDRDRRYRIIVEDCVTTVFRIERPRSALDGPR